MGRTQRIGPLLERLTHDLDDPSNGEQLMSQLHFSRFHALRTFQKATGETPQAFRRRLRLERAAHRLGRSLDPITEVALDAGFESLEGFSRAFRRAFRVSPSVYRRSGTRSYFLPAPNGIHFQATLSPGGPPMDLLDLLLEHDRWLMNKILERCLSLSDAEMDAPLARSVRLLAFEDPQHTVRDLLDRHLFWKEVWVAAIRGQSMPEERDTTVTGMLERLERGAGEFSSIAREVAREGRWQALFVDALCVPPETFSFVGVVAQVVTYSSAQRSALLEALAHHGIHDLGSGDPLDYEQHLTGQAV